MKKIFFAFIMLTSIINAQQKISGILFDEKTNEAIAYGDIKIPGTNYYTSTNNDGSFYLETSENYPELEIGQQGYITRKVSIKSGANYDLVLTLKSEENSDSQKTKAVKDKSLDLVTVKSYKKYKNKKENPAYRILRELWARRKTNGVKKFDNYKYDEYEKIEFDLNNIDSSFKRKKIFRKFEFIFDNIDTSAVTGKAFLPMYLNENIYKVVGKNRPNRKERRDLLASKTSGFKDNQIVTETVKNLYKEYNVYNNRINFFDKAFVSPIATDGFAFYEYHLLDTLKVDDRKCYKIKYFPKRDSDFTFKGSMCIDTEAYNLKSIEFQSTKGINVNFVRDIYVKQDYTMLNDSIFLPERNYVMMDLTLIDKREKSTGLFAHRTQNFKEYDFNNTQNDDYFDKRWDPIDEGAYSKDNNYWSENRFEKLSKNENSIYKMLDSLNNTPKFKRILNLTEIVSSGYYNAWNAIDIGNFHSFFGKNDIEGYRARFAARTYFGQNDMWRIGAFLAYGFKDEKFKYGVEARYQFNKYNRFTLGIGTKRDIEQLGAQLTTDDGILTRSFASSTLFARGGNTTLSNLNKTNIFAAIDPVKNLTLRLDGTFQTIKSASPTFDISFLNNQNQSQNNVTDSHITFSFLYQPKAKYTNYGLDRYKQSTLSPTIILKYTKGFKGILNSDFAYDKIQFRYSHPLLLGVIGRSDITVEVGKTFGKVPLSLLSVIPANQSYGIQPGTFAQMNFYEFISDTYATLHIEHHDNGKLFSYIPLLKKLNFRTVAFIRGVLGDINDENKAINLSNIPYISPNKDIYYEYGFGIENIGYGNWRIFRIDFNWRGNYLDKPDVSKFGIKIGFSVGF